MLAVQRDHAKVLWRSENHSSVHSDPFYINGFLYGYSGDSFQNKGSFKCLDVRDGRGGDDGVGPHRSKPFHMAVIGAVGRDRPQFVQNASVPQPANVARKLRSLR